MALRAYGAFPLNEEDHLFSCVVMDQLQDQAEHEYSSTGRPRVPGMVPFICVQMALLEESRGRLDGKRIVEIWRDAMMREAFPKRYADAYYKWVETTGGLNGNPEVSAE